MDNTLQITMRLKDEATEQLKKAVNNVNQSFDEAKKSTSFFGTALADIGKIAAGIGIYKLAESVVSYTKATIQAGIETSKFYENARIGLTTLLGDGNKAVKLLRDIQKTAMETPFDASALVKANQLLITAGVNANESQKIILDLGNAILATGGGNDELMRMAVNLQQIKNIGKATALDIKQFAFAGIPIYQMLAKAMGKNVEEIRNMDISYEMLITALAKARQEGGMFYKGIENASGSLTQLQSNFKETIQTTTASILEQSGVIDLLKNALKGATDFLLEHKTEIIDVFVNITEWIIANKNLIKGIGIFLGILGGLTITLGIIAGIITVLSGLFTLLMSPIVLIGIAIAGLITIFILFGNQIWSVISNVFNSILNTITLVLSGVWNFITSVFNNIVNFFITIFNSIVQIIINIVKSIINFILPIYEVFRGILALILGLILIFIATIFNILSFLLFGIIVPIFTSIFNFIFSIFQMIYNTIASILNYIWNSIILPILTAIYNFFVSIFTAAFNIITTIFTAVYNFIASIWNSVYGFVVGVLTNIKNIFTSSFNNVKKTIVDIFTSVYDWFTNKLTEIWNKVTDTTEKILNAFKNMASGITNALRSIKFPHLSIGEGSITIMGKEIKYPKLNVDWYEKGGWVKNTGLAVVHAGEYVLSRDMLAGRQPIGAPVYNNSYAPVVNAIINTPIDLDYLAYKLSWNLRNG